MKATRGNTIVKTEERINSLKKELKELKKTISIDKNYMIKSLTTRKYEIIEELSNLTLKKKMVPNLKKQKDDEIDLFNLDFTNM